MSDFRAYGSPLPSASEIVLSKDESHHLVAVNRAREASRVVVFNGQGREWHCTLLNASKNGARLKIWETVEHPPLPFNVSLAQSLPKGSTMESIVKKATEIGASHILPLITERTQVHLEGSREDRKLDKWEVAALEAAKQCGNPWLPRLEAPVEFSRLLPRLKEWDLVLVASLQPDSLNLRAALTHYRATHSKLPAKVLWLVGPEGDFSPAEMEAARAHGCVPITLGPLVLRCETAATYALSILSYELANG